MRTGRSITVITSIFPPVNGVGVHRTVALCRHLVERGDRVTVITARPAGRWRLDPRLLSRVPPEVRVVRTAAPPLLETAVRLVRRGGRRGGPRAASPVSSDNTMPASSKAGLRKVVDWVSRWLILPDGYSGWFVPALAAGLRLACRHRPDLLYSSAPAWTSHLVAAALSHFLRVPWVADFRDPWCGSAFRTDPYGAHRWAQQRLEELVVQTAGAITCAWGGVARHLVARYPNRGPRIHTILNGFDPDLLARVPAVRLDAGRCVLLHAGSLYGPRSPVPLLTGLRRLRETSPADAERLLAVLVGCTSYNGIPIEQLAKDCGVAASVRVLPPVPHETALAYLKGADVALLFGQSGGTASVPAKTYEYIGAGKPILAIGAGLEVRRILQRAGCRLWVTDQADEKSIAGTLRQIVAEFRNGTLASSPRPRAQATFTWEETGKRLGVVLDSALRGPKTKTPETCCQPKRGV